MHSSLDCYISTWQHQEWNPPSQRGIISLLVGETRQAALCPSLLLSPHSHPLLLSALGSPGLISLCPKHIYSPQEAQAATHPHLCFNPLVALHISYSGPTSEPSPLWGALHNPRWSSAEPLWLKSLFWMTPLFRVPQWSTGHVLTKTVRKPQGFHMRTSLPLQPFQMVAVFGFQSHLSYSMGHGDSGFSSRSW